MKEKKKTLSRDLRQRAFNQNDYRAADRLGKIKIHVVDPDTFPLSPTNEEYLYRMRRCFTLTSEAYTTETLMLRLHETFPTISSRSLSQLIQDTKSFYGDFTQETKKFNWLAQQRRLLRKLETIDMALKPKTITPEDGEPYTEHLDTKEMAALYKESSAIEKLLKELRAEMPDVKEDEYRLPPSTILFDDNPALLPKGGYVDIEEADIMHYHEEE